MAGGLFALLDDVALIAKKAAASAGDVAHAAASTSTKAAAVVVDDTAVAPDFVRGVTPARELPIVWQITKGSLVNKIVIILPVALLLSWLAPWALTPILMVGGTYLSFEGGGETLARRGRPPRRRPARRHRPRRVRGGEGPGR
jgi:predicted DNA repair protein MutK